MKNLFVYTILLILTAFLPSCQDCITGKGTSIEESRTVEAFDQIILDNNIDLSLIQVNNLTAHKVILTAQENILPNIICDVDNSKLNIGISGCTINAKDLGAAAFFSQINKITLEGSGNISSENPIFSKRLTLKSNGSGNMKFEFSGDMLVINTDGSGDFVINGHCKDVLVNSSGSGYVDLSNLKSDRVKVENSGSGNVHIHAVRKANLELNGSGNISLKGNPQNLEQKSNGSGEITRIN